MDSIKVYKEIRSILLLLVLLLANIQIASADHEGRAFNDDPEYYRSYRYDDSPYPHYRDYSYNYPYYRYPYYTHHQYHVIVYDDHYARYNRYFSYPPVRYGRYRQYTNYPR